MVKGNDGVTVHRLVTSDLTGQNGLWRLADAWQYHPIVDKDNQPARTGQIRMSRLGVLLVPAGGEGAIMGQARYAGAFTHPQALDVAGRP